MRTDVKDGILRGCPVCRTKVDQANLGLRDYRWLEDALPGKAGPTDLDFVLQQASTGRCLVLEYKPPNGSVALGQRIALRHLVQSGFDVWVVREPSSVTDDAKCEVALMDERGDLSPWIPTTVLGLREMVRAWWDGDEAGA